MNIRPNTILNDLIQEFPAAEVVLEEALPAIRHLEQDPLRNAALSAATVEHLALKAGRDVSAVIHDLRIALGMETGTDHSGDGPLIYQPSDPEWVRSKPVAEIDGVEMLSRGVHPLAPVQEKYRELLEGETLLLNTSFPPAPLIEALESQGADVFSREDAGRKGIFRTFFRRS